MADDDVVNRIADAARAAMHDGDLSAFGAVLAEDVQWDGHGPGGACRSRGDVLATLQDLLDEGTRPRLVTARTAGDRILLTFDGSAEEPAGAACFVVTLNQHGQIARLQNYSSEAAATHDVEIRRGARLPVAPVDALVPFVHVADVEASVAFYRRLGFQPTDTHPPGGRPLWAFLESGGARLMVAAADERINAGEQAVLFYLYAHDLDALRDHLVSEGETPGEIVDGSPGPRREMRLTDPDGYCLMIAESA